MFKYEEVLKKIKKLEKASIKLGLNRTKKLLNFLFNPEKKIKFIHIAGTNAKTSTASMLSSVLVAAGFRTGCLISPFVSDFRETMTVNKKNISKKEIVMLWGKIENFLKNEKDCITKFEVLTCIAFKWFAEKECDVVVLETGLGGRLDSTNVIDTPLISVITSISLDHTEILGKTLKKISREKCGIIKHFGTTVLYPEQDYLVFEEIKKICNKNKNKLTIPKIDDFNILKTNLRGTNFKFKNKEYFLPLLGKHQIKNVSVVFEVLKELKNKNFKITHKNIQDGLKNTKVPARLEIVKNSPLVILDGAHNPDSVAALAYFIKDYLKKKRIFALFSMLKRKDCQTSLKKISKLLDGIVITSIKKGLSYELEELSNFVKKTEVKIILEEKNLKKALKNATDLCNENDVLIIFGSFYLARKIKRIINKNAD
ncbi:MAG: bifunctional folylpolyglutamate synthase/dihydrofolate synthase [Oscillospiraceae bacterium]|jgi:dihydrofolate synthase/folylpolyglutamate synthase|nr:bifunctional folylpolyglutamate synthase/dihydrofolate synthase [Oscillospiraceae bacterium]